MSEEIDGGMEGGGGRLSPKRGLYRNHAVSEEPRDVRTFASRYR